MGLSGIRTAGNLLDGRIGDVGFSELKPSQRRGDAFRNHLHSLIGDPSDSLGSEESEQKRTYLGGAEKEKEMR